MMLKTNLGYSDTLKKGTKTNMISKNDLTPTLIVSIIAWIGLIINAAVYFVKDVLHF